MGTIAFSLTTKVLKSIWYYYLTIDPFAFSGKLISLKNLKIALLFLF